MVSPDNIQTAIAAHASWKARLRAAIGSGKFDVPVATVKQDNQCQFGKWLYGSEISAAEKQTEHYRTVRQLHAQFHEQAAKVVEFAISGQKDAAGKAIGFSGDYTRVSSELTAAMARWRQSV